MKRICLILLPLFLAGVVFSVWKIYEIKTTEHSADDNYQNIAELATGNSRDSELITSGESTELHTDIDFTALQEFNPDIIAWIRIPDTIIDYPVLQGEDDNEYLRHTPDGEYSIGGSIFLEWTNASDFSDNHSIIYGHHFRGSYKPMFTHLVDYKAEDFYKAHPVAELFTPAGKYTIRFFSCYVTALGDNAWRTQLSDEEFSYWLRDITDKALYNTGIIPSDQDRIITLSTCCTEYKNARFVIHGVLQRA